MRRPAAALAATSVLAVASLFGPAATAGPPTTLTCPATGAAAPACAELDDLQAQLAVLAPVLDLAGPLLSGPVLSELGAATDGLTSLLGGSGAVPIAGLAEEADGLLAVLGSLPAPLEGLLGATLLGDLTGSLEGVLAQLAVLTAPVVPPETAGSSSGGGAAPTPTAPAAPTSSDPARSTSASAATGFGGGLSGPTLGSPSSLGIPDVPLGSTLHLGSLAVPEFRLSPGAAVALPAQELAQASADEVVEQVQLAAEAMSEGLPNDGTANALAAVAALSILLVGTAALAHLRQDRRVIPD